MYETVVEIVGVGNRITGVNASGKGYDFIPVAFVYSERNMEGKQADHFPIDPNAYERLLIVPGAKVRVIMIMGKDKSGKYGIRSMKWICNE